MEEKNNSFWNTCMFGYIPAKYFFVMCALTILGSYWNCDAPGFLGGFTICSILGLLLTKIGDNTPIVNTYLGGGGFVAIFGSAAIAYFRFLPENTHKMLNTFVRDMDYIGWVVAGLICGAILTMDRKLLIKAGIRYFLPVIGGIACAFALVGITGMVTGYGWREAILFIALPIMGGGTSAGAVPTSQAYGGMMTQGAEHYLSLMLPAVILGNALSVVAAGILKSVGMRFPSTTGNGVLMKGFTLEEKSYAKDPISIESLGRAFVITGLYFVVGRLVSALVPNIHYYAWTILACALCKVLDLIPADLQRDLHQWYQFMLKVGAGPAVYFAIGYAYTDLGTVVENFSALYLLMCLLTVVGALIGSWFIGKLVGFYPVESAITAGLCMSNMGGSGDIATLGAANRMELMPFAQISSRLGGAIIILLASFLPSIIGQGL